jgi:DNA repair protein RadD
MQTTLTLAPTGAEIKLRDYQRHGVQRTLAAFAEGKKGLFLVCPTGGGKTVVFTEIASDYVARGLKVVVVAHRDSLIKQAAATFHKAGLTVGIIKAKPSSNPYAPVQVVSIDSMRSRKLPWQPNLIIIDEAHLVKARRYTDFIKQHASAKLVCVSATPIRLDGSGFEDLCDEMVTMATIGDLLNHDEGRFLVPAKLFSGADISQDLAQVKTTAGDYNQGQLEQVMSSTTIVGNVIDEYLARAAGRKGVVFATGIAHSKELARRFNEAGIKAEHIDGTMSDYDTARALHRLKLGETSIVTNANMLCEGWDEPSISYVGLARPTQSLALYIQQAGRGLRLLGATWEQSLANGKEDCIIIDHGCNVGLHGHILDERVWSLEGTGRVKPKKIKPKQCPECEAFVPKAAKECNACGHVFIKQVRLVTEVEAPVEEVVKLSKMHSQYIALLKQCRERGYKAGSAYFRLIEHYEKQYPTLGKAKVDQGLSYGDSKRYVKQYYGG